MYLLAFYVPSSHKESVKEALFNAGGGRFKNYHRCSFETKGVGQFEPLANAQPYTGKIGNVEFTEEWKVEMICEENNLKELIAVLKHAHPYEEPAYHLILVRTDFHEP